MERIRKGLILRILGIDPGLSGSFSLLNINQIGNISSVKIWKMMDDDKSIILFLKEMVLVKGIIISLEQITGGASFQGKKQAGFHSNYRKLVTNYTLIRTVFFFLDQPFELVHPLTWQKYFGLQGIKKSVRKKEHCLKAKTLFPSVSGITQQTCDSLLIAEYERNRQFSKPGTRRP